MILVRLFLLVALALAPTSAMAFTITFDNHPLGPAFTTFEGPISQPNLFTYGIRTGSQWDYSDVVGNGPSSLNTGEFIAPAVSDTFEFFLTGGGVFSLTSFQYASRIDRVGTDTVDFIAENIGIPTPLCSGINSNTTFWNTNNSCSPLTTMDHLLIRVANTGPLELYIDNINLNGEGIPTPEPASLLLLGAGLVGVVARSRKSKA